MKKIFKGKDEATYDKSYKRLSRTSQDDAIRWANSNVWATQGYLEEYQKHGSPDALRLARQSAVGILAAIDVVLDNPR